MQINRRGSIILRDPDNRDRVNLYRKSELVPIMLKEFDRSRTGQGEVSNSWPVTMEIFLDGLARSCNICS
jgi:hypothetical protein